MFIVAFLALYTVFIFRGLKSPTVRPTRLAVIWSLELWCGLVQAIVNIGGMVGLLPITGVVLPFVSYGGTALAVSLTAMGVVANVSRSQ